MKEEIDLKQLSREYLKSYYSINSFIGCSINCAYCFLAPIKIVPMRPVKVTEERLLIEEMLRDKYFVKDSTVISINNRTDPFITREVKESTFKLLEIMDDLGLKNIVTVTTKAKLERKDAQVLDKFKNIKVVIIVTYNGIPLNIQPIKQKNQEETMKNISKCKNVTLLHQFRPIISGINDDEKTISKILKYAKRYCNATIYQGVRVNQYIKNRLNERDYNYTGTFDTHKQKSENTDKIFNDLKNKYVNYPIFDHTSCALSYMFQIPDYNMHYIKGKCDNCKNYRRCYFDKFESVENIQDQLLKIGVTSQWKLNDGTIIIDGELDDEQRSYIRHILHLNSKSKTRLSTYSEKFMEGNE